MRSRSNAWLSSLTAVVLPAVFPVLVAAETALVVPTHPREPVVLHGFDVPVERTPDDATDPGWAHWLGAYVDGGTAVPAMLGRWTRDADTLRFEPRLPFLPGQAYRVSAQGTGERIDSRFELPAQSAPSPGVEAIYPSAQVLPANVLRFYIYFSREMRRGDLFRGVQLQTASGVPVPDAFVETIPELWDPGGRRATVLVHPGRVKRGIAFGERAGPSLEPDRAYRLVIGDPLRSREGGVLPWTEVKTFSVAEADTVPPDPSTWRLVAPAAATRDPLTLEFPEPLDHAMLGRCLQVLHATGETVPGNLTVGPGERIAWFTPAADWIPGRYALEVLPALEDPSGNRLDMRFDRRTTPSREERDVRSVPFEIAAR